MRTILLPATVLALALLAVACGGSAPAAQTPAATTAAASAKAAPGDAKIGDTSTCPVSGEEFVVAADSPRVEYEGKTYYFCCGGCAKKFQADPKKFLAKPAS